MCYIPEVEAVVAADSVNAVELISLAEVGSDTRFHPGA